MGLRPKSRAAPALPQDPRLLKRNPPASLRSEPLRSRQGRSDPHPELRPSTALRRGTASGASRAASATPIVVVMPKAHTAAVLLSASTPKRHRRRDHRHSHGKRCDSTVALRALGAEDRAVDVDAQDQRHRIEECEGCAECGAQRRRQHGRGERGHHHPQRTGQAEDLRQRALRHTIRLSPHECAPIGLREQSASKREIGCADAAQPPAINAGSGLSGTCADPPTALSAPSRVRRDGW